MPRTHRIMFLRDSYTVVDGKLRPGRPIGCIAIKVVPSNNTAIYQLSVVNPLDAFDRKMARQLALGRMVEEPVSVSIPQDFTMHDVSEAVMQDIAQSNRNATRARKAAKLWFKYNY